MVTAIPWAYVRFVAAVTPRSRPKKPKNVQASKVGPRTDIGGKKLRIGDLILVEDPKDKRQSYLAQVAGGYCIHNVWHVTLTPTPGVGAAWVPQSVKARHVTRAWRKKGRS